MKKYLAFILVLTFASCGSLDWSFFSKKKSKNKDKEVAEEFNLSEDIIVKFEEKSEDSSSSQKSVKPVKLPSGNKKSSAISKSKDSKQASSDSSLPYPKDYPEELIKLSKKAKKHWKGLDKSIFTRKNEKMFFEANYAGITMGKIVITNDGPQDFALGQVYEFKADIKTSPFYSYLYEMEGTLSSHFLVDHMVPIKFRFDQVEHKKVRNDLQYFDFQERKTISLYKKESGGKIKKRKLEASIPVPYVDSFSIINFLRASKLKVGDNYVIPMVHKAKVLKFKIRVAELTKLETKLGTKEVFKIHVDSNFTGETLKSGKLTFWVANDATRALMQVKVKIKLGSVVLKLVDYQN